ncbi:RNA chaperone Hfq [Aquabacterium humicola]|uniref:RNA chaperone Hfq n=1 Tax=Aquabacterium humicola TaxID=3237377 RepID=UPI002543D946|nr:RNA chaperone Hfq [Rubrivivax pictus]
MAVGRATSDRENRVAQHAQLTLLEQLRSSRADVSVYLVNGIRLRGTIVGFDKHTILLASGTAKQLINKSAVSTVSENVRA